MTITDQPRTRIAIACGGTGGHFFPGLAVAQCLRAKGCDILLFVSDKDVDREALKTAPGMRAVALPAAGLTRGRAVSFLTGFWRSYRLASTTLRGEPCSAVLAMGGFTGAPPILAGKRLGAVTFLHESNSIPGRANRWLSRVVNGCFVGFPGCVERLHAPGTVTGTPVRQSFQPGDAVAAKRALGLDERCPVLLVMGGSQGASALNTLVPAAAALLSPLHPGLQWLHLSGKHDAAQVKEAYSTLGQRATVLPFLDRMDLALAASSLAVTRAGASTLAELAAARVPAVLIPYPTAADNHQHFNAAAFADSGAALLLPQASADPEKLARSLSELLLDSARVGQMRQALGGWHRPDAAERISTAILETVARRQSAGGSSRAVQNRWNGQRCAAA